MWHSSLMSTHLLKIIPRVSDSNRIILNNSKVMIRIICYLIIRLKTERCKTKTKMTRSREEGSFSTISKKSIENYERPIDYENVQQWKVIVWMRWRYFMYGWEFNIIEIIMENLKCEWWYVRFSEWKLQIIVNNVREVNWFTIDFVKLSCFISSRDSVMTEVLLKSMWSPVSCFVI